jgi:hypothetical protein
MPIALASIGPLPLPLMSRSIVIRMRRHDPRKLKRFDVEDLAAMQTLDTVYSHIWAWARDVKLDLDPELPCELRGRDADNWRPLISIADACGPAWGALAREAAIAFAQDHREEDIVVVLLRDIREVFDTRGADRITGKALLIALRELEDAGWSEFSGVKGDGLSHKLRASELRAMLRSLGIETRSIWPARGRAGDRSGKGYYRSDFEPLWRAYCDEPETGKSANILALKGP